MPLRFYTDTHIDKQVAVQLRKAGVDILRCEDVGLAEAKDSEHLEFAIREQRTIITKDDDFIQLHKECMSNNTDHYGIFFCPFRDRPTIGLIVEECLYYFEAIEGEVGSIEKDIMNQLFYIT